MGEVYLAQDEALGRCVALKVLRGQDHLDPDQLQRFFQEARAASSLNHPYLAHVYEVGTEGGLPFMAMELVEGESLRARLDRTRLSPSEALSIGIQCAKALSAAHRAGIVHRDIKPENMMLRPDGFLKVLDFGLAKIREKAPAGQPAAQSLTQPGMVVGTVGYMSPEQVRGLGVDERSDVFSLGAVLYEMLAGQRAFNGATPSDLLVAVLIDQPAPLAQTAPEVPPSLVKIVTRCLEKDRDKRYQTSAELLAALEEVQAEEQFRKRLASSAVQSGPAERPVSSPAESAVTMVMPAASEARRRAIRLVLVVAAILAVAGIGWGLWRSQRLSAARRELGRLEALVSEERFFEAFDLARNLEEFLGDDPKFRSLQQAASADLSIETDPAGAAVSLDRFEPEGPLHREELGAAPIVHRLIPRGDYVLKIEKEGHSPYERTLSTLPVRIPDGPIPPSPVALRIVLPRLSDVPPGMVPVPGGEYTLSGWDRPVSSSVKLADFFMDRYEVSNREFREFIQAGGYQRKELWKRPFVKDGKTLSFEEAMSLFKDRTGLAGPRDWSGQTFAEGEADFPVSGVTWYEAAAYAEFRGKVLPSIFQWDRAARNGESALYGNTMPWGILTPGMDLRGRANLVGSGPVSVRSLPFGMSAFGCYHMAGNVSEWLRNASGEGNRFATGAAWDDPVYQFGVWGEYPAFFSARKLGFRCAKLREGKSDDSGEAVSAERDEVVLPRSTAAQFQAWSRLFQYKRPAGKGRVLARSEGDGFVRETVAYPGTGGSETIAYLLLPAHARPGLEVIHFLPAGDVARGYRTVPESMEQYLSPLVRAGRAAFAVVLKTYSTRNQPVKRADPATRAYLDEVIRDVTDMRLGLDYLATRPDMDPNRISFAGVSAGANLGIVLTALEPRYRSVCFISAGAPRKFLSTFPGASPVNYAPHISTRKLVINGRYDETFPLETDLRPLYALMPEPKRLEILETGHALPLPDLVRELNTWLDESQNR